MRPRCAGSRADGMRAVASDAVFGLQLELVLLKSSFMHVPLLFLRFSWTWHCCFWPSVGVGMRGAKAPYKESAGRGGAVSTAVLPQLQLKVDFSILGEMKAHFSRVALSLASLECVCCGASDPAPHRRACLHTSPHPSSFLWRTIWTIIESVQRIDGRRAVAPLAAFGLGGGRGRTS